MSFETWGFTDKHTHFDPIQRPLPFDSDMKPKPAVTNMLEILLAYDKKSAIAKAKLAAGNGEPLDSAVSFLAK